MRAFRAHKAGSYNRLHIASNALMLTMGGQTICQQWKFYAIKLVCFAQNWTHLDKGSILWKIILVIGNEIIWIAGFPFEVQLFKSWIEANFTKIDILALWALEADPPNGLSSTHIALVILMQDVFISCIFYYVELVAVLLFIILLWFIDDGHHLKIIILLLNLRKWLIAALAEVIVCLKLTFISFIANSDFLVTIVTINDVLPSYVVFP